VKREAGRDPHHHVKLLDRWLDGGEQRSGGAPSAGSSAMAAAEELGC
jgi:hypothetical protein